MGSGVTWPDACEFCKGYPMEAEYAYCTCDPKPTSPERPSNVTPPDPVNHPSHYQGKVETIDAIESALGEEGFRAYCRGNAIKYLSRLGKKGPAVEDARKAAWYINKLVESYE